MPINRATTGSKKIFIKTLLSFTLTFSRSLGMDIRTVDESQGRCCPLPVQHIRCFAGGCWLHCSVRRHYSGIDVKTVQHSQLPFDQRNSPTSPITVATAPPTNIHIALSVGEPVKNREISELNDFVALTPKIISRIPPARIASETTLFIEKFSFLFQPGFCG